MNSFEVISQNLADASLIESYWDKLIQLLDSGINEFIRAQASQRHTGAPLPGEISFSTPSHDQDKNGCDYLLYRSSLAILRLYKNIPPGYIYGEIEPLVPKNQRGINFSLGAKSKLDTKQYELIGHYIHLGNPYPGTLANALLNDLSRRDISSDDLEHRYDANSHERRE